MNISTPVLRQALSIQEEIERLETELQSLLSNGKTVEETAPVAVSEEPTTSPKVTKRRPRRNTANSRPLAESVAEVLREHGKALKVSEIFEGLTSSGFQFTSPDPKKNLAVRIYKLKGVKQVGPGKFAFDSTTA